MAEMGSSDAEGNPIQPEGGLLPLLGDMLFAVAILVMMYPSLRRTLKRIDRQFCRQLRKISEVILALAALCFVLTLMIAQQTRVTYCAFIRPYVENTSDGDNGDDYVGVVLKVLVGALLVFNYFCASGLQRLVGMIFRRFRIPGIPSRNAFSARPRCENLVTTGEVSNNSNTNSQTPVPPSPTQTQSDIFSSVSFPALDSESFEDQSHTVPKSHQRLYCDVGTMVRFPEFQNNLCTLQFCKGHVTPAIHPTMSGSSPTSSCNCCLCSCSSGYLDSSATASTGFCAGVKSTYHHSPSNSRSNHHNLDTVQSSHHLDAGLASLTSSCQDELGLSRIQNNGKSAFSSKTNCKTSRSSASSHPSILGQPRVHESDLLSVQDRCPSIYGQPGVQGGIDLRVVNTADGCRSSTCAVPCCSYYSGAVSVPCSVAVYRLPCHSSPVPVKRRSQPLPSMPKMTRSGKVYGYG